MASRIDKYLLEKTEELAFITIMDSAELGGIDIEIDDDGFKVPVKNSVLVKGIQDNTVEKGINMMSIIDAMLYIMGIDSEFRFNDKYIYFIREFERLGEFSAKNYCGYTSRQLFERGEISDALVYMKAAYLMEPDDEEVLYHYAITLQAMAERAKKDENSKAVNDYMVEALGVLEHLVKVNPFNALGYYQLGYHYAGQSLFTKAMLTWRKALELGVNGDVDADIRRNLEEIHHKVKYEEGYNKVLQGNPEEGVEILKELESQFPDWWNLLFMIGLGYRSMNMVDEAVKYYEKILLTRPSQVDTLVELGLCAAQLGDLDKAIEKFDLAARIKEEPEILCNLGMAYLQNGDLDNAIYYIERAYELDPMDEITNSCLRELSKYR